MVIIEEVSLNITWPDDEIRLVMMQPFIKLELAREPFVWLESERENQLKKIRLTLDVASTTMRGGSHFTLLPEYSIPNITGIETIDEIVARDSWPQNSVLIAGVDGLRKNEYSQLCDDGRTHVSEGNKPSNVEGQQWINCAILWAKQSDSSIERWIQPKISPSWAEEAITASDMFSGRAVYVFATRFQNGTECRFMYLICFDWIASAAGSMLLWEILQRVDRLSDPTKKDMNLFFVLQHNPKPNHHVFLENTRRYFEEQTRFPFTPRSDGAVLFINSAGGAAPARYDSHGRSSMVFSPRAPYDCQACPPSAAVVTKKLRESESLGDCKDSLFRESGECVHAVRLTLPQFVNLGPAERSLPIRTAEVFALNSALDDPRTPGQPVPAIVKWVNDWLDGMPTLLVDERNHPLKEFISKAQAELVSLLRKESDETLSRCIDLAGIERQEKKWLIIGKLRRIQLVDNWDDIEVARLRTIVQTLSMLRLYTMLSIRGAPGHAVIMAGTQVYDVIVVSGANHTDCFEHAMKTLKSGEQRFKIVITKNSADTVLADRDKSITVPSDKNDGKGPNITDPYGSWRHYGHQNLVSECLNSTGLDDFNGRIGTMLQL